MSLPLADREGITASGLFWGAVKYVHIGWWSVVIIACLVLVALLTRAYSHYISCRTVVEVSRNLSQASLSIASSSDHPIHRSTRIRSIDYKKRL